MYSIRTSRTFPDPRRLGDRGGFTLIELLVALMISSILVTVIYQLMLGNSRFVQTQASREEVQQNARAALDLIAGDLRTVAPSGIQAMAPDSVRFYLPRAWGVLCDTIDQNSATAWVLFPAGVLASTDIYSRPNWGIAVEQTTSPSTHTDDWQYVASPTEQTSGDPCTTIQPALDASQHETLGFNRPGGTAFASAMTILPGTQVLVYEEVKYDVAESSIAGIAGMWIRRMVGRTTAGPNMQPMAGPVPADSALRLSYFEQDGVTPATTAADVRQVRIQVIAQSRSEEGTGQTRRPAEMDTVATSVSLRNVSATN